MPDVRLDTTQRIQSACEVPPIAGVPRLLVPCVADAVYGDRCCVPDGVEVTG